MTRTALLLAISALLCGAGIVRSQTITEPSARMALAPLPLPEPGDERKIALGQALLLTAACPDRCGSVASRATISARTGPARAGWMPETAGA